MGGVSPTKHTNTGDKTMSKSGFEIRAEMLQLAKEYMDQQSKMNFELAEKLSEQGQKTLEEFNDTYKMYSMEDLIEKAKEMYSFVSNKE